MKTGIKVHINFIHRMGNGNNS